MFGLESESDFGFGSGSGFRSDSGSDLFKGFGQRSDSKSDSKVILKVVLKVVLQAPRPKIKKTSKFVFLVLAPPSPQAQTQKKIKKHSVFFDFFLIFF